MLRSRLGRATTTAALLGCLLGAALPACAATNWSVRLTTGSKAQAHGGALGTTAATSSCPGGSKTIKVAWTAVAHAATYTVRYATTSAGGAYTTLVSGQTGASYTWSAASTSTNYWFEVVTVAGNWTTTSVATTGRTIGFSGTCS